MTELENVETVSAEQLIPEVVEEVVPDTPSADVAEGGDTAYDGAIEQLARELAELRALIETRQASEGAVTFQPTLTEAFRALYPDVSAEDIPDTVWEEVRGGLSLEASYALWDRRETLRRALAQDTNRKNASGAWGRAEFSGEDFLSPDEVRSMTRDEVRRHYARIVESMKHWN